jgi:flagellar biogenesis protein FliO
MWEELQAHERFIRALLALPEVDGLGAVREHHDRRVRDFQHERLIHLLVTLFVALFALLAVAWLLHDPSAGAAALAALLLALTAAYLLHYFRLENGVQRLYGLSRQLDERLAGRPLGEPSRSGERSVRGA